MIKVYLDGANGVPCQLSELRKGFIELGCDVTEYVTCADLIYSNNPSPTRTQIVKDKKDGKLKPGAKLIFTVLDYPIHLENTESFQKEIPQIRADLAAADAVCSISEYTQRMVKEKYGFDSFVVYNPIKSPSNSVTFSPEKTYKFLHCGRRYDSNKNFRLVAESMMMLGFGEKDLGLIGSEGGWGSYIGTVSDENLYKYYFGAEYVFSCGEIEGLSLTIPESMAAGCVPVVHNKLSTKEELLPRSVFPEYEQIDKTSNSIAGFIYYLEKNLNHKENLKQRLSSFYKNELEAKFNKKEVAKRIYNLYERTKNE